VLNIQTAGTTAIAISASQAVTMAGTLGVAGRISVSGTNPSIQQTVQNAFLDLCGGTTVGTDPSIQIAGSTTVSDANNIFYNANAHLFRTSSGGTTYATIDTSGNLLVGATNASQGGILRVVSASAEFGTIATFGYTANGSSVYILDARATGQNNSGTAMLVLKNTSTSRSISAAGTINASGADYAEYMTKAGDFIIAKGDVVGVDSNGKLTNVFTDAVSFMVKSTDPSYVGGDSWGSEDALGLTKPNDEATQEEKDAFDAALEIARQRVDRIAFAGQVPVNVTGATAGQYIIPVNDNGAIKGEAVSNPTFEQYQTAVGKVIAIESDGRAKIIVKVA
jgi:hypothetical protein